MNSAIQTTLFDDAFQSAKTNNSAVTNAPNYTGLNGDGYFVGGSGLVKVPNAPKVGIGAGVDGLIIPNPKKKTDKTAYDYSGGSVSLLVGSPGIEVHGGVGYTRTFTYINIFQSLNALYEGAKE